ncbi:MAG: transglycosylase domain-containing protein [Longilinea sp.]|nr:transglycosylase domain-containing protein [Longilinea sp.]
MRSLRLHLILRHRHRRQAGSPAQVAARRTLLALGASLSLLFMVGLILSSLAYVDLVHNLPSLDLLPLMLDRQNGLMLQPTRIYDRTGQNLLLSLENPGLPRRFLTVTPNQPDAYDPKLLHALIALEQPDFWQSPGFDLQGLTDPQPHTIAERLVSDLLLENEPAGLRRSLRMRLLAAQITTRFGRSQVLEWYLNSASFGHLTYGADNAARLYLGKSATDLEMDEVALLIAVLESPALNPLDAPTAALQNRQALLLRLLECGAISSEDYWAAFNRPAQFSPAPPTARLPARAFSNLVLHQLSEQFGRQRLERGGLRVLTSLDYDLQLQVSCTLQAQLKRNTTAQPGPQTCRAALLLPTLVGSPILPNDAAASAVILDPQSGEILAYVGDTTLTGGEQATQQPHDPGSLLTPFIGIAAFAHGLSPATLSWDIPNPTPGLPANLDGNFHGPMRLRTALANDYLSPFQQLLEQLGGKDTWRSLEALNVGSLTESPQPQAALSGGSARLSPLDLAQDYAVLANQGTRRGLQGAADSFPQPIAIRYVEDSQGHVLLTHPTPSEVPVLSPSLAYLMHDILSDEAARWPTLGFPNALEIGRPAGAKIGRVSDGSQAWAAGYTPQRVLVVWVGQPEATTPAVDVRLPAGIWHAIMLYAHQSLPVQDWSQPTDLIQREVCETSGLLPTRACPNTISEIFIAGNEPISTDTLYRTYTINRETGRLATVFTPPALIEERTYLIVPPEAAAWALSVGLPTPPQSYDAILAPPPNPQVQFTEPTLFAYVHGNLALKGTANGADFRSYSLQVGKGINPQTWLQIGSEQTTPVHQGLLGEWDTTQTQDGLYVIRMMVVRQNAQVESAILQITVDNTPPRVTILSPTDGKVIPYAERQLTLLADVEETIGIQRVEWWVDGKEIGQRAQPPFSLPWDAPSGQHTLEVRAYDLAGNLGTSTSISFSVQR